MTDQPSPRTLLSVTIAVMLACLAGFPTAQTGIRFIDITAKAGIRFTHNTGAFGKKYLPETMGSGVVFFDADGDGLPDLLILNGRNWPGQAARSTPSKLYRNNGDGTFADVTKMARLELDVYAFGAAAADYDNDGAADVFITALDGNRLFKNDGKGRFVDVTKPAGVVGPGEFSTSAAWLDYDSDGLLDLFVANYVQWSIANDLFCMLDGKTKSYCTPESYRGASARLWRNRGNGTFEDVTKRAGVYDPTSKGLGVALLDFDQDGRVDLLLVNDTEPNKLYRNNGNGTFTERGVLAGVGFSEEGVARAGMGVDAADYDRSGYPSVVISNFSNQMVALYHNEGNGLFIDDAPRTTVGRSSLLTLGFAVFFMDYDLDGWLDIFIANGHIEDQIEKIQPRVTWAEPPHMFRNLGKGRFEEVTKWLGEAFMKPRVARGAAMADIDNDGDLDLAITTNGGPAALLRNDGGTNASVRVRLVGAKSNRDGIGAVVRVAAGDERQWHMVRTGSSYLSQNERLLTFGLGARREAEVEVRWPSGTVDRLGRVPAGHTITVQEGRGISDRKAYARSPS